MEHQSWDVLSHEQILDSPHLLVRKERVAVPNGPIISDYFIIENRGWAGIVPLTPEGLFLLNRQYKHGIGEVVIEFSAGGLEPDEDPKDCAIRELMEETGYSTDPENVELLSHLLANPTGSRTRIWLYLARDVRKTGTPRVDPVEVIETFLATPQELLTLIHSGLFAVQGQVAAAYLALERLGYLKFTI